MLKRLAVTVWALSSGLAVQSAAAVREPVATSGGLVAGVAGAALDFIDMAAERLRAGARR